MRIPMRNRTLISSALIGSLSLAPLCGLAGCSRAPLGDKPRAQGAIIGGAGGALAGALIGGQAGKNKGPLGALIGGVVGAGGGYLIGAQKEKVDKHKKDEAVAAHRRAESHPATVEDVEKARTADLNDDGFVTLDEVVAMKRANLSDHEMIDRLQRTGQVFELTEEQEKYLEDRGVSHNVIVEMRRMGGQDTDFARTASGRLVADDGPRPPAKDANGKPLPPKDFERYRDVEDAGRVSRDGNNGGDFQRF